METSCTSSQQYQKKVLLTIVQTKIIDWSSSTIGLLNFSSAALKNLRGRDTEDHNDTTKSLEISQLNDNTPHQKTFWPEDNIIFVPFPTLIFQWSQACSCIAQGVTGIHFVHVVMTTYAYDTVQQGYAQPQSFTQPSYLGPSVHHIQGPHGYSSRGYSSFSPEIIRTIYISGFPHDVKERELNNMLRFLPGTLTRNQPWRKFNPCPYRSRRLWS